jgi:autotransporter passenger strand-loop-strand repeat protein
MTTYSVTSGEVSNGITLRDGDFLYVSSGGYAAFTTLLDGGGAVMLPGGTASFTTISAGGADIMSGGTAYSTTVSNGGVKVVASDGTANFTTVSDGGTEIVSGGTVRSALIGDGGTQRVLADGLTSRTTVNNGGFQRISSGGSADYTTAFDGGVQVISTGGSALGTVALIGGSEIVFSGGTTSSAMAIRGFVAVSSGGTAGFTTVSDGGYEYVFPSGTTSDTTLSGGYEVLSGGTATSLTVDAGSEVVSSGGLAIATTVNEHGLQWVVGGFAVSTTVSSGATEYIFGGTATDTTVALGGMIDVSYFDYTPGDTASVTSNDVLSVTLREGTYTQQLACDYAGEYFQLTAGAGILLTPEAPCFLIGTRIPTDRDEVAVQDLRIGALVQTVLREALTPIIWIGRREVDCAHHPTPRKVWPVRVSAGAFGPGRPAKELFLSPDHAVYINDVLIPIRHLINGATIAQVAMNQVTYYHVELPRHDVVLAEGLPAESFLDMKDGSNCTNRLGPVRLYPDFSARMWQAFGCAPLIVTGPELLAARSLVARLALELAAA